MLQHTKKADSAPCWTGKDRDRETKRREDNGGRDDWITTMRAVYALKCFFFGVRDKSAFFVCEVVRQILFFRAIGRDVFALPDDRATPSLHHTSTRPVYQKGHRCCAATLKTSARPPGNNQEFVFWTY